jgi:hypothetical protein
VQALRNADTRVERALLVAYDDATGDLYDRVLAD